MASSSSANSQAEESQVSGAGHFVRPGFYLFLLEAQETTRWIYSGISDVVSNHVVDMLNNDNDVLSAYAVVEDNKHIVKIGGYINEDEASNEVLFLDTSSEQSTWDKSPPLIDGRMKPKVVSVCGKLFVMGGYKGSDPSPLWAEYLDLYDVHKTKKVWQPVKSGAPKFGTTVRFLAAPFVDQDLNKGIIVGTDRDRLLYKYNIKTQRLEKLANRSFKCRLDDDGFDYIRDNYIPVDPAVVVGDMLIWMEDDILCVYHIHERLVGHGYIKGIDSKGALRLAFCPDTGMRLLYIGNEDLLCLICLQKDVAADDDLSLPESKKKNISLLHFFNFTVPTFTTTGGEGGKPTVDSELKSTSQLEINKSEAIVDALFMGSPEKAAEELDKRSDTHQRKRNREEEEEEEEVGSGSSGCKIY